MAILLETSTISDTFTSIGRLYEVVNIQNQVIDGSHPYPENMQTVKNGMSIEFMYVIFHSPKSRDNMLWITEMCLSSTLAIAVTVTLSEMFRSKLEQVNFAFWWDLMALVKQVTLIFKV